MGKTVTNGGLGESACRIKEEKSTSDHIPRSMPTTFSHTTKTGPELRNGVALQSLLPFLSI